jgi:hypothetical protein
MSMMKQMTLATTGYQRQGDRAQDYARSHSPGTLGDVCDDFLHSEPPFFDLR